MEWYLSVIRDNYANFSGRARRSEYWYFVLFQILALIILLILGFMIGNDFEFALVGLYFFATVIPWLAVLVRRLHDSGRTGWYFFVRFIPLVGNIWLLVLLCMDGDMGPNQYGRDPKAENYHDLDEIGNEHY